MLSSSACAAWIWFRRSEFDAVSGRRVERGDDEVVVRLVVDHPGADEPLVGGGQDAVVQRLLQREGLRLVRREPVHAVVDGQAQPVALGGVGQVQVTNGVRQVVGVALLQAQGINLKIAGQINQLTAGMVLTQVVADDSNQGSTSSVDSRGKSDSESTQSSGTRGNGGMSGLAGPRLGRSDSVFWDYQPRERADIDDC